MNLTDAQLWAMIIAFFSPLATAVVQQPRWSNVLRTIVASLIAAAVGTGSAYFAGDFTGRGVVSTVLLAVVVSTTAYTSVFKPVGAAPAIERATAFGTRQ
ncbi:hypothetical protein [Kitasatospora sp. NPDC087315]|uniref:hypothetical protein n=1 Tax=Kitasatospora sp. NPDC087315 TaxID=3364069 RepID=UPI00381EE70E